MGWKFRLGLFVAGSIGMAVLLAVIQGVFSLWGFGFDESDLRLAGVIWTFGTLLIAGLAFFSSSN